MSEDHNLAHLLGLVSSEALVTINHVFLSEPRLLHGVFLSALFRPNEANAYHSLEESDLSAHYNIPLKVPTVLCRTRRACLVTLIFVLNEQITAAAKAMVNILKEVDSRRAEGNHTSSNQVGMVDFYHNVVLNACP